MCLQMNPIITTNKLWAVRNYGGMTLNLLLLSF